MQCDATSQYRADLEATIITLDDFVTQQEPFKQPLVRVLFYLEQAWHGHVSETIWARWHNGNGVRLLNTPFFAKGVSRNDVIRVRRDDGWLTMDRVVKRNGHSTVRLILRNDLPWCVFQQSWQAIQKWNCTNESMLVGAYRIVAVDIPPRADFDAVHDALERGERLGHWKFEEGHCGHPLQA